MNKCLRCKTEIEHEGACDPCVAWFDDKTAKEAIDSQRNVWNFQKRCMGPKIYRQGTDGFIYLKHNPKLTTATQGVIAKVRGWDHAKNLYFHSKSGTGKTHLAKLLAEKEFETRKWSIGILRCASFQKKAFYKHSDLDRLLGVRILVLDDIDKLQTGEYSLGEFHDWIDQVRSKLIITANKSPKDLTPHLAGKAKDYARAEAITSRFQPCDFYKLDGPDLRRVA